MAAAALGLLGMTISVAATETHAAVSSSLPGLPWDWGDNSQGQLGDGTISNSGCFCKSTPYDAAGIATPKGFNIAAFGSLGVYQGSATDGPGRAPTRR